MLTQTAWDPETAGRDLFEVINSKPPPVPLRTRLGLTHDFQPVYPAHVTPSKSNDPAIAYVQLDLSKYPAPTTGCESFREPFRKTNHHAWTPNEKYYVETDVEGNETDAEGPPASRISRSKSKGVKRPISQASNDNPATPGPLLGNSQGVLRGSHGGPTGVPHGSPMGPPKAPKGPSTLSKASSSIPDAFQTDDEAEHKVAPSTSSDDETLMKLKKRLHSKRKKSKKSKKKHKRSKSKARKHRRKRKQSESDSTTSESEREDYATEQRQRMAEIVVQLEIDPDDANLAQSESVTSRRLNTTGGRRLVSTGSVS